MTPTRRDPHRHDPHRAVLGKWYLGALWVRDKNDPSLPFFGDADELVRYLRRIHRHNLVIVHRASDTRVILHYIETGNTYAYKRS